MSVKQMINDVKITIAELHMKARAFIDDRTTTYDDEKQSTTDTEFRLGRWAFVVRSYDWELEKQKELDNKELRESDQEIIDSI